MNWIARVLVFTSALVSGTFATSLFVFSEPMYIFSIPLASRLNTQMPQIDAPPVLETKAKDVSVCDLKNEPAKYNHSVVKVSGYFSRGFEDSTLYDPTCKSRQSIWVELGGKRSIGVMYCCGFTPRRTREEELKVEGIKLPLTEDANFAKYDKLLADGKRVKANVIGTFFSGGKIQYSENTPVFYAGYGHMGIGSLFVVQQVLSVEVTKTEDR
jgi:hypothetical protein